MPRTPILSFLARLARDQHVADETGTDVPTVRRARVDAGITRRAALRAAVAGAGLLAAGPLLPRAEAAPKRGGSRVAVVGAGFSGLTAALTLADAGVPCTVYEASARAGGRVESNRTDWAAGQVSEWGGELIDTGHTAVRGLARRFAIPIDDVRADEPAGSTSTFRFGGAYYTEEQAIADFPPVYRAARKEVRRAGYPTTYRRNNRAGRELDAISVREWIETRVPGGLTSPMGRLLDVAYTIEYGRDSSEQSALNLLYLLAYQPKPLRFAEFGESDEVSHVQGGNDRIASAIAAELPEGTIEFRHELLSIARDTGGAYLLRFATPSGETTVEADRVILTIPFSVLRTIDVSAAGFRALKQTAIRDLGYGSCAKLNVQFTDRHWRAGGAWGIGNGSTYSDTGHQATWEVSRAQPGTEGIVVNFTGGPVSQAVHAAAGDGVPAAVATFLDRLEPLWPGVTAKWNGRATLSTFDQDPWRRGAYACWLVGQYTAFSGIEGVREGACHFAGEHCSTSFQGFMEGAVRSGRRAAREVIAAVRRR